MKRRRLSILLLSLVLSSNPLSSAEPSSETLLTLDNGTAKVGIDRGKGASITWLSWAGYPKNMINSADPGRLILQSYTYRYWLVVGSEKQLASRLDFLHQKYATERGTLTTP